MAILYITVFDGADIKVIGRPVQQIAVTYTGTSAASAAIAGPAGKIRNVRLFSDADCSVEWNADPTAVSDGTAGVALGADNPEVFGIQAGDKIAAITRA